ncbi:MAG: hypothetical protein LBI30_00275 [Holosporales bacterium]|jgi:hypothetical protein|nr:hypothetical protein [Holosporales bacterium]
MDNKLFRVSVIRCICCGLAFFAFDAQSSRRMPVDRGDESYTPSTDLTGPTLFLKELQEIFGVERMDNSNLTAVIGRLVDLGGGRLKMDPHVDLKNTEAQFNWFKDNWNEIEPLLQLSNIRLSTSRERKTLHKRSVGDEAEDFLLGVNLAEVSMHKKFWRARLRKLSLADLVSFASGVAKETRLPLNRATRREKTLLLDWFEENWEWTAPFLSAEDIEEEQ